MSVPSHARIVIVGGGVTGLALAYELEKRGARDLVLFEAEGRLGGNIATERHDGFLLDLGPDSWVAQKPETAALCRELGLAAELVAPRETGSLVHLVDGGKLVALPRGMVLGVPTEWPAFLRSSLFSWRAKLRVLAEPFVPRVLASPPNPSAAAQHDVSVGAFAERRLGHELTDKLVAPLLGGIFAGSAWDLSLRTAFPQLVAAEHEHASLVRAFRARRRAAAGTLPSPFLSLRGGMGSLIERLLAALRFTTVHAGMPVTQVRAGSVGYDVTTSAGTTHAEIVAFAGPAAVPNRVLELPTATAGRRAPLPSTLASLRFGSAVTVSYGFRAHDLDLPEGSGFLVPPPERKRGLRILAGTFVSSKWAERAPADHVLVRVFFGGPDEAAVDEPDPVLIRQGLDDLRKLLSIRGAPVLQRVFRLRGGSPRPTPGHLARVEALRASLDEYPGLHLLGNGYDGSGISDCIRQAQSAAARITR